MITQGDIWWADLGEPRGSRPGYRRPVVVVQGDRLNRSRIATAICVPLTTALKWAEAPGNVLLRATETRLPEDSVANVSLMSAFNRDELVEWVGRLSEARVRVILEGIDIVLGR